ncbi:signal transduction histidine kinase [Variovorax boronicumulans]|uniref:histidine kinase n=1 Tax=Variovorax boronicumulans TaxID=436515 RepID=A0AAW8DSP4_9BURK|nr:ATP-binding protein [Variovorax boronicumulans]MDP9876620.1 signal transduction histidine kinase [Variovorax boronicumulans]MDP9920142.1 signal transduction histidine kinase [Variovorax boronicumulans]MDP9922503.1 signal transduction histidine kinase [Variovorax boronicumulans]
MLRSLYRRHLYVRIWLAVVGGVVILTLMANWIVRVAAEAERERLAPVPREVVVLDSQDRTIGTGKAMRVPGQGLEFDVQLSDGRDMTLRVAPRERPTGTGGFAPWRTPFGLGWMIALVGVAVALGVYPIVRRITQRLETLQRGVQRWGEGDLSARVIEEGQDEVADLSKRFNASAERIEQLVRSHKSLLANASHELRSPLTRIRMGLELMGDQPSPAAREEISRNIGELDQLIDEILLASRLDASEADMGTIEAVDLTGLAAEECAQVNAELDLAEGTDNATLTVPGVSRLLRRAIRNLLENARRYGAGEISVELGSAGGYATVRVNDRGPGVPATLRERIFEPFYRLPGASERNGGVGLGLALVKSIAERHGGSVRCEDRPGGGASFVIRLPAKGPAAAAH